jgi:hypothetical protein
MNNNANKRQRRRHLQHHLQIRVINTTRSQRNTIVNIIITIFFDFYKIYQINDIYVSLN